MVPCRHCYTQYPLPCSRPPPNHTSARASWTLMGKSWSVSCGVTVPFSWVLVHRRFLFMPSKSLFPQSCVSSGGSMVGLMAASSRRAYAICRSTVPRVPVPAAAHCWPVPLEEILKHSLTQSLGPGMHKVCVLVALLQRIRCLGEEHRRHGFDPWSQKIPWKATKPMHHNYWAYAPEPRSHKLSPRATTTERKWKCYSLIRVQPGKPSNYWSLPNVDYNPHVNQLESNSKYIVKKKWN